MSTDHYVRHADAGISQVIPLPASNLDAYWDAIILPPALKDQLLSQAALNFTVRRKVGRSVLPLHGIILLTGAPGVGKTSLAKGLASKVAGLMRGTKGFNLIEVDPHALTSASLGKSQRAVTGLFGTLAEYAAQGPTIVLLDEVETLVADRAKLSLEANPIDVHRATDAALVQLDHLAETHRNLLFLATSNFVRAIDSAFVSRADLVITVPLPDRTACHEILRSTLSGMAEAFPKLTRLPEAAELKTLGKLCEGLDGRQVRKLVATACTFNKATALDPGNLSLSDLQQAIEHAQLERTALQGGQS